MKYLVLLASMMTTNVMAADTFAEYDFDFKNNQKNTAQDHVVNGFVFGTKIMDDLTIGVKAEVENVRKSDNIEGLIQGQVKYNLFTVDMGVPVTPFVTAAIGEKYKVGNTFEYGVAGLGVNFKLTDKLGIDVAGRYRNSFEAIDNYETNEASIKATYAIAENHIVGIRAAVERGDSNYDVVGALYQYRF